MTSNPETPPESTRYSRPEGVMGGPCLHCQASQPEHRGLTCDEVREHRRKAMRRTFAQAHTNATLETIKQHLETMIHSAEVYVDAEDVITAYKVKTGALHKLIGHLGLSIPVNHPVVGAHETTADLTQLRENLATVSDSHKWLYAEKKRLEAEAIRLREEIEVLRGYGNKDCTYMADQELERRRALKSNDKPSDPAAALPGAALEPCLPPGSTASGSDPT